MALFNEKLKVNKDFITKKAADITTAGSVSDATCNDISFVRFTAATAIDSLAGGVDGKELIITNANSVDCAIANDSGGTAANRIITGIGGSITLATGSSLLLKYDGSASRWRVVGSPNMTSYSTFTGDSGSGGTSGLVPGPYAGATAAGAVLSAAGTWQVPPLQTNYIINGSFDIWQRATTATPAVNLNTYVADRWQSYQVGVGRITTARTTTSLPASGISPYGFRMTVQTIDATLATTDQYGVSYKMEGLYYKQLHGRDVTISFWVKGSDVGTYSMSLRNSATDRTYVATYTINAANTYEKKTITVRLDNSGTWLFTANTVGLRLNFTMGASSTLQTSTLNTWQAGNFVEATGSTNLMGTVGKYIEFYQVQLNLGTFAQDFASAGGNAVEEIRLCQRYCYAPYWNNSSPFVQICPAYMDSTTTFFASLVLPAFMMFGPSLIVTTVANLGLGYPGVQALATLIVNAATPTNVVLSGTVGAALTANKTYFLYRPGTTENPYFEAEL